MPNHGGNTTASVLHDAQFLLNKQQQIWDGVYIHWQLTSLIRDLHWLWVSHRIEFKLSVLVFRRLHGTAPAYLSDELRRVADSGTRWRLRSTSSAALVVPPTQRTIGDRSFPVPGARVWNALPSFVTDSSTISAFKRHLKMYLFARSLSWLPHCCIHVALFFDLVQCSWSCSLYDTLIIFVWWWWWFFEQYLYGNLATMAPWFWPRTCCTVVITTSCLEHSSPCERYD